MKTSLTILFLTAIFLASPAADAHTGGFSYEAPVDGHFADIGANTSMFQVGEPVLFDFHLYKASDPNNPTAFDNVYVAVEDDQQVHLSASIHQQEGAQAVLSYVFPEPGKYNVSARFQQGSAVLASASFDVNVEGGDGWYWRYARPAGGAALGIVLVLAWQAVRKRRRQAASLTVD